MGGRSGLVCISITLLSPIRNARLDFVSTTVETRHLELVLAVAAVLAVHRLRHQHVSSLAAHTYPYCETHVANID
jgi:hypothetical protein